MEDNSNRLEDFLRKKLTDPGVSGDDWDKPDPEVWKSALAQLNSDSQKEVRNKRAMGLWGLALLLLFSVSYNVVSYQEIYTLNSKLSLQENLLISAKQETSIAESRFSEEKERLKCRNENLQIKTDLDSREPSKLKRNFHTQERLISKLNLKNKILQSRLKIFVLDSIKDSGKLKNENSILNEKKISKSTIKDFPRDISFSKKDLHPKFVSLKNEFLIPTFPLIKERLSHKKFELGYSLSLTKVIIPSTKDFDDFSITSDKEETYTPTAYFHGVNFAFSPKPNFYVRAGIRRASLATYQDSKFGLSYDKSKEYTNSNGKTINDLKLNKNTPYSQDQSNIGIEVPQGTDLESGDLLAIYLNEYQEVTYYQVPIGIGYFLGTGRLQWHLQGGAQWNQMFFGDYFLEADIEANSKSLEIDKIEVFPKSKSSKQFASGFAGIGLDYRLFNQWHARADLIYNYHFIKDPKNKFSNSKLIERSINLGLYYRF